MKSSPLPARNRRCVTRGDQVEVMGVLDDGRCEPGEIYRDDPMAAAWSRHIATLSETVA
jgi:hypothetical protein